MIVRESVTARILLALLGNGEPGVRELKARMGRGSFATLVPRLRELERAGYLRRGLGSGRNPSRIELTGRGLKLARLLRRARGQ